MELAEYRKQCKRTAKFTGTPTEIVCNMCMGIAGEAGEVVDYLKKVGFHGHEFDKNTLIKELGDLSWYMTVLADYFGINMEDVLSANIEKLKKRYLNGWSEADSIKRVDIGG